MRIAYIIEGLYNSGGMERVLSVIANSLSGKIEVAIITLQQKDRPLFFPLEKAVECYDLAIYDLSNAKEIKSKLNTFLSTNHFDIVVSLGGIDMYYLHQIKDDSKKIVWFHFAIDIAKTTWAGPNPTLFKRLKAQLQTWKRIYHACKYDRIVLISKADLKAWKKITNKATLIYNPVTIENSCISSLNTKNVISVGRLDYQKGFDYLIHAWSIVSEKYPNWHLNIFGEGDLRGKLQQLIDESNLSSTITLRGRSNNLVNDYRDSSIYVMSSRAEGFGLVLVEAASCGLPLISYDCPSGPSEIIEDGVNGLLIKQVGDIHSLANAICELIENNSLRTEMGKNAKKMVERYSRFIIISQWVDLFNNIISSNNTRH